ncbi:hypothetical protein [Carboxylicivirga mesophila]|nr:hypothetical protein [Carboxylicivirga mesophila]
MSKKKKEEISDELIKQLIENNEVQKEALEKILKGMKIKSQKKVK